MLLYQSVNQLANKFAFSCFYFYCRYVYPYVDAIYTMLKVRQKYIEPSVNGWNCLVYFDKKGSYNEYYYGDMTLSEQYRFGDGDKLWITQLPNGYYLYNNTNTQNKKSSVYFLTIVILFDDGMQQEIKLKKNEYIVGNLILTPLHILRYLKYNSNGGNCGFTNNTPFSIELMDNKLKVFKIRNGESILLDNTTYSVI